MSRLDDRSRFSILIAPRLPGSRLSAAAKV